MRYKNQNVFINEDERYKRLVKKTRGMEQISQFDTPSFKHPSASDMSNFKTVPHIWSTGDRYFKLAHEYYSSPTLWWIIALYNQKPTEFHVNLGDIIYVPVPLETVLFYLGY
jgi:hypothetical protein